MNTLSGSLPPDRHPTGESNGFPGSQAEDADAVGIAVERDAMSSTPPMAVHPFAALALLVFTACAGLLGLVLVNHSDLERAAREGSERLVAAVITSVEEGAKRGVYDYAWWDEAIEKGLLAPDPAWLSANFGNQALVNLGLDGIVLLGSDDTPLHAHFGSDHHDGDAVADMVRYLAPLLARSRQSSLKDPNPQLAYQTIAGIPHLIAVAALSPVSLELAHYTSAQRGVMVLVKEFDDAWVEHIATLYDIVDLSFVTDAADDAPRHVLRTPEGEPVGFLTWRQDGREGADLIKVSWQGGLVLGAFLISAALLFGRLHETMRAAQRDRQKVAQLAGRLGRTSARLQQILDSVHDGILEIEADGHVTFANRAAGAMTGWGGDGLRGRRVSDLIQSDSERPSPSLVTEVASDHVGALAQSGCLCRPDGSVLHVDVHISRSGPAGQNGQDGLGAEASPASRPDRSVIVFRDVTDRHLAERVLRERQELYRQMFQANSAIKLLIDPQTGAIVDANPAAAAFYGYSVAELCQLRVSDINLLPANAVHDEMQQAVAEKRRHFLFQHRLKSGAIKDVEVYASPISVAGHTLIHSIVFDTSEKKEAEKEVWRLGRRLKDAIDSLNEGFTLFDGSDRLILSNSRFLTIYPCTLDPQSVQGMTYEELVRRLVGCGCISCAGDEDTIVASLVSQHQAATGDTRTLRLADGRWLKISERRTQEGGIVGVLSDVSELEEHRRRIEFIAHHDMLTALPNRVLFQERFERMIAEADQVGDSVAVLSLDLDGFKAVNDCLGHAAGDGVLRQVADILRQNVREGDTVARIGGDEFVVLMRVSREQAGAMAYAGAERLVKVLRVTIPTPSGPLTVHVSIGIALYPQNTTDGNQLIRLSDQALYRTKENGRHGFTFSDPQSSPAPAEVEPNRA